MNILLFTDNWYNNFLNQEQTRYANSPASADAVIIANSVLTGFAMVAQAIDNLGCDNPDKQTIVAAMNDIANVLENISESIAGHE